MQAVTTRSNRIKRIHKSQISVEHGDIDFEFVLCENDGMAWVDGNKIVINARWLTNHPPDLNEVVEEILRSTVHEIVEHYYGMGHDAAVYAENIIFNEDNNNRVRQ